MLEDEVELIALATEYRKLVFEKVSGITPALAASPILRDTVELLSSLLATFFSVLHSLLSTEDGTTFGVGSKA
jgi:hypothetical protein